MLRSAIGWTVSVSEAVLLPGVGSVVPAGGATTAVLVTVPVVAVTVAVIVNVTVPPEGSVGITTPAPSRRATVVDAGHTAPPVVPVHDAAVLLSPVAAGSVTMLPLAAE